MNIIIWQKGVHFPFEKKKELFNITRLPIIYCKSQLKRLLQASVINFELITVLGYCENQDIIKKGIPQTALI